MVEELLLSNEKSRILTLPISRPAKGNALNFNPLLDLRAILNNKKQSRDTKMIDSPL